MAASKEEKQRRRTEVVNVKVAHIRPRWNNLEEWCNYKRNVYIGRAGIVFITDSDGHRARYPPKASIWANPYTVKEYGLEQALVKYEIWIRQKIMDDPDTYNLAHLRGKRLGCWCVIRRTTYDSKTGDEERCVSQRSFYDSKSEDEIRCVEGRTRREAEVCHGQVLLRLIHQLD